MENWLVMIGVAATLETIIEELIQSQGMKAP